jgi:hypothetical protein
MVVAPPAYTGRSERRVSGFNAEVEEGAAITWVLTLDRPVMDLRLLFGQSADESLKFQPLTDGSLQATRAISETTLYHAAAVTPEGLAWNPAEIYSLKVLKDQAPAVSIRQPAEPRTEIAPAISPEAGSPKVIVEVLVADDYGITEAHLVATVAKGSGEAVKFREQNIAFDAAQPTEEPLRRRFLKTLDLGALGLEPGDELYFHVEATDNRPPSNNRSRSETRFIVLKGPDESGSTAGKGVTGINLVPQYFRSQRQIIIDTEKLIADRAVLSEAEFRERANNLGVDQQLLRQRYGQFLGEEAESDAPLEEHFEGDGHDHGPAPEVPQTPEEIVTRFGHQHDSQDEATLFDRETKGTMRQALAAMWEAERLLRMAEPAEALAPENRALEILKQLQQAERSYVQRVGFETAPIDLVERRLHGDVSEVPDRAISRGPSAIPDPVEADVRTALRSFDIEALRGLEPALMKAATDQPEIFLEGLRELRRLVAGETPTPKPPSQLERALLRLLRSPERRPARGHEVSPSLAEPYFQNLERTQPKP